MLCWWTSCCRAINGIEATRQIAAIHYELGRAERCATRGMSSHGSDAQEALCSQLVAVDDRSNALGLWAPGAIGAIIGAPEIAFMAGLVLLAVLVPSLAVAVRRLHDAGRSG